MKIYSVGPSGLSEEYDLRHLDQDKYDYLIYSYVYFYYEGAGVAVFKDVNGEFTFLELDHCSCYGPLPNSIPECIYTLDEMVKLLDKRRQDAQISQHVEAVAEKFKELEGLKRT